MADADPLDHRLTHKVADDGPDTGVILKQPTNRRRKLLLTGITAAALLAGGSYTGWYLLVGSHHISTENAYVGADTAQVTPMVAGQAVAVAASDTDAVKRGDVLVRFDDSDARISLATAQAELAKAERQFGQASATSIALAAQVDERGADIAGARAQVTAARAALDKAQVDFGRRQKLAANGAVSGDELTSVTNALAAARATAQKATAALTQANASRGAATANLSANDALIRGATVATAPDVLTARARVRQAQLELARTVIRAPIDGIVANRTIQVGQRVAPGATVMRIVPVTKVYVDANFKEGQLRKVLPGQRVTLTADLYGDSVEYHGRVAGFSGGTGSSFALIPAQNATGNWIKVVQRLPVRVTLDPAELAKHPLRVGLSMNADIDVAN